MPVDDKAKKGDVVASAIIGMNKAIQGSLYTVAHPVETAKGLAAALRSPIKTGKAVGEQIKSDFKADPVQTMAELLMPMPGPKGAKPRKIVVPEKLALPREIEALRAAKEERKEGRIITRPKTNKTSMMDIIDGEDKVRWQEDYQRAFEGWYPGNDRVFRKDVGIVEISPHAFKARTNDEFELVNLLRHPDLVQRLVATGRELPTFLRDKNEIFAGGAYTDGKVMGEKFSRPRVRVGGRDQSAFDHVMNHEVQHAVQDFGDLQNPYLGANMKKSGLESYFNNPGEIEARIAGMRTYATPDNLKKYSFPRMYRNEEILLEKLRRKDEEARAMTENEHFPPPTDAELEEILNNIAFE